MKYLILIALLFASRVYGADVFVDNTASCATDDGSSAHPWCTIQAALDNAAAGQDIKIRTGSGTYSEVTFISGKNGTAANPIILEPDTGASFVIRNTDSGSFTASIEIKESDYWTIRNLTFDANGVNPSMMAIHVQCASKNCVGWNISGNTFQNWRQPAAATNGPNVLNFSGCHVDFGCATTKTISGTIENNTFTNNDHAAITLYVTLNTIVRNNIITAQRCGWATDVNTIGIQVQYKNFGLQIYNNRISDFTSIASCPRTSGATFTTSAGIWSDVCYGDENTDIYNNLIYNIDQGRTSYAGVVPGSQNHGSYGMFIEANCGNYRIKRNVIYNIGNEGIANSYHSSGSSNVKNAYTNNTIFGVLHGFCLKEGYVSIENNIVKNASDGAIKLDCTSGSATLVHLTPADYNLYDDGGSQTIIGSKGGVTYNLANWRTQCSCDTNSFTGDPLFISTTVSSENLALQSTSPAINAGSTTATVFYNGVGPDIGAYETFTALNAEVGAVAANKVVINLGMNINQPVLVTNTTGWATTCGTISSIAATGNAQLTLTLSGNYAGGANCAFTYTDTTGNATDSALIGNSSKQRLVAITSFTVTDNTGGAPAGSVNLSHWRIYLLQGSTDTAWIPAMNCAADSTNCTVAPGSKVWVRFKLRNNSGSNYAAFNLADKWRYNGGSYVLLTDTYVNGIKVLGNNTQLGTVLSHGTVLTQDQLTSNEITNVSCYANRIANNIPALTLNNSSETECARGIDIASTAILGDTYEMCPFRDDGTALTCSTPIKLTVGGYQYVR